MKTCSSCKFKCLEFSGRDALPYPGCSRGISAFKRVIPCPLYEEETEPCLCDNNTKSNKTEKGIKFDEGKQNWYAMPLEILEPLADVFRAGEKKYKTFNCLNPFDDPARRFYDAMMRHMEAQQVDPLAKDQETGCYHAAQIAFNALLRLYNCKKLQEEKER